MSDPLVERVTQVFKRFDKKGTGKITRTTLSEVLKRLDDECWVESNVDELLKAANLQDPLTGEIDYEDLVEWIMGAPPDPLEGHPVCQAAFEGDIERLRELLDGVTLRSVEAATGYVKVKGEICGLWTMCFNTFQLKALQHDATLRPATPLHWAAFAAKAEVVRYFVDEWGLAKDFEADFGFPPFAVAVSHRLDLDGEVIIGDDEEVKHLLEEDASPLCPEALARATSRFAPGDLAAVDGDVPAAVDGDAPPEVQNAD
eukprot:CAMPEP_0176125274 /NCGR_PEP_ID=MMETSP0120_2-20121206/63191_1 /TAXON_ID=160619 /ORGANISM="Kryptoperidinium foliaceum, Strain CCMP 1326" /LENGTH=257 /DNA_ID=CAMNT_0017460115 /DNA_START=48 /DNA_END=821 /DNA_ORIENTATION=+